MIPIPTVKSTLKLVKLDLSGFGRMFFDSIKSGSNMDLVATESIKLTYFGKNFDTKNLGDFKKIVKYQLKPFDLLLYFNMKNNNIDLNWTERSSQDEVYQENDYNFALFYCYFMLMVRDKVSLNKEEKAPAFLSRMRPDMDINKVRNLVSDNNIDLMDHSWIFEVDIGTLGEQCVSRLYKGIAGMRMMHAITKYRLKENSPSVVLNMVENLKAKIQGNIYREAHVRGQPMRIKNCNLSKNLTNLLLNYMSEELIQKLVDLKLLRAYPTYFPECEEYKLWTEDFFDYLTTPLVKTKVSEIADLIKTSDDTNTRPKEIQPTNTPKPPGRPKKSKPTEKETNEEKKSNEEVENKGEYTEESPFSDKGNKEGGNKK